MNKYQKEYANFLRGFFSFDSAALHSGNKKLLKVVFDCSNGSVETVLKYLNTKTLKAILINQNIDGEFPAHGPDPLKPGAMNELKKAVLKNKADLGVIFDADGDRAFFMDDCGRVVNSDQIARLLIWNLDLEKIVSDVRASWLVKKPTRFDGAPARRATYDLRLTTSKTGHYFIKKIMREKNIPFGYENSGHYYFDFPNFGRGVVYDSGILAAIKVINAVSKLPYKLSDFVDLLPVYFRSGEINIRIMNQELGIMDKKIEKIENHFKTQDSKFKIFNSSHVDGLSMEFNDWWFNIRLSNTEPVARVNIEAVNKKILAKQTKMLLGWLHNNTIV